MQFIFLYGPDGSGKTTIAIELASRLNKSVIIPFEPSKLGKLKEEIDSGYGGENSGVQNSIPRWKSLLFLLRYNWRFICFRIRYHGIYEKVIVTRGPLEFGINDTHKKFPSSLGRLVQNIISQNKFLITRPVDIILRDKPELPRLRILQLYEKYLLAGCTPVINDEISVCVQKILNLFRK